MAKQRKGGGGGGGGAGAGSGLLAVKPRGATAKGLQRPNIPLVPSLSRPSVKKDKSTRIDLMQHQSQLVNLSEFVLPYHSPKFRFASVMLFLGYSRHPGSTLKFILDKSAPAAGARVSAFLHPSFQTNNIIKVFMLQMILGKERHDAYLTHLRTLPFCDLKVLDTLRLVSKFFFGQMASSTTHTKYLEALNHDQLHCVDFFFQNNKQDSIYNNLIKSGKHREAVCRHLHTSVCTVFEKSSSPLSAFLSKNPSYKAAHQRFLHQIQMLPNVSKANQTPPSIHELANAFIFLCDVLQRSHPNNTPPILLVDTQWLLPPASNTEAAQMVYTQEVMDAYGFFLKRILLDNPHHNRAIMFASRIYRLPGFNDATGYKIVDFPDRAISSMSLSELATIKNPGFLVHVIV